MIIEKLHAEHNSILGKDLGVAASHLSDDPHLLNQLPYTFAVIKESMRLFPPASGVREAVEGVSITDDEGNSYPTGKTMVWILHQAIQRNPKYWKESNEFVPERWSVGLTILGILSRVHGGPLNTDHAAALGQAWLS